MAPIPRNFNNPSSDDGEPLKSQGEIPMKNPNPTLPPLPTSATPIPPMPVKPIQIPIMPLSSSTITTPIAPKPVSSFNPMMPMTKVPPPVFSGEKVEKPAPKPETTPMLKDFPPISTPAKQVSSSVPKAESKVETKPAISPSSVASTSASVHTRDAMVGYLAVVAFIIAVLSAVLLGAGYFDLI